MPGTNHSDGAFISKITIGDHLYKAILFIHPSIGSCAKCDTRTTGVLLRFKAPIKTDVRLCHKCLLRYFIRFKTPQELLNKLKETHDKKAS